jgi:hypothetical protein
VLGGRSAGDGLLNGHWMLRESIMFPWTSSRAYEGATRSKLALCYTHIVVERLSEQRPPALSAHNRKLRHP